MSKERFFFCIILKRLYGYISNTGQNLLNFYSFEFEELKCIWSGENLKRNDFCHYIKYMWFRKRILLFLKLNC